MAIAIASLLLSLMTVPVLFFLFKNGGSYERRMFIAPDRKCICDVDARTRLLVSPYWHLFTAFVVGVHELVPDDDLPDKNSGCGKRA